MASPQPRVGVVTYPGSQDDRDALWALAGARRRGDAGVARGAPSCPTSTRSSCPAGSRTATTCAAARSRASRPPPPRCASSRTQAGSCSVSATASRSCARPASCRASCCGTSRSAFVCRDVPLVVERDDLPFTSRCTAGETIVIPVKHGDGRWFAPPELVARARGERPGRAPLRASRATARSTTSPASATPPAT